MAVWGGRYLSHDKCGWINSAETVCLHHEDGVEGKCCADCMKCFYKDIKEKAPRAVKIAPPPEPPPKPTPGPFHGICKYCGRVEPFEIYPCPGTGGMHYPKYYWGV